MSTIETLTAKELLPLNLKHGKTIYLCDKQRHLICFPYSKIGLHEMAKKLGINKCWFHKNHYDMPKTRIAEITERCHIVSSKLISLIINNQKTKK